MKISIGGKQITLSLKWCLLTAPINGASDDTYSMLKFKELKLPRCEVCERYKIPRIKNKKYLIDVIKTYKLPIPIIFLACEVEV